MDYEKWIKEIQEDLESMTDEEFEKLSDGLFEKKESQNQKDLAKENQDID